MTVFDDFEPVVAFERFPFFVGLRSRGEASGLPSFLPFELGLDRRLALPRLRMTPTIQAALDRAYAGGSMLSTPLGASGLAAARLREMREGVIGALAGPVVGKRILEVGCGRGDLLATFQSDGAVVVGCEIGPQGQEAARRFGFPVIDEPLRLGLFDTSFDAVISYGCLEHIVALDEFFATCRSLLRAGGLFFHSVPNADSMYASARTDELCHEHVNYFTLESARRLLAAQAFRAGDVRPTAAGNEMHLWGYFDPAAGVNWPGADRRAAEVERDRLAEFGRRAKAGLAHQVEALERLSRGEQTIGLYAGGHTVGSLVENPERIRYYDGDEWKHGKCWLPSLQPIRAPRTLRDDPVDVLIVSPDHHFEAISRHLVDGVGISKRTILMRLSQL